MPRIPLPIMLIFLGELEPDEERWHSFRERLTLEAQHRRDWRYPRAALMEPSQLPFWFIFGSGLNQALITLTGFDHLTFQWMEDCFTPFFNMYTPYADGSMGRLTEQLR